MMILAIIFIGPFIFSTFFFKTSYKKTNLAVKSMIPDDYDAKEALAATEDYKPLDSEEKLSYPT